jgi:dihydrofolate reductase
MHQVCSPSTSFHEARQCLEAGLLNEVGVGLVPVMLGAGTPLFADLGSHAAVS